MRLVTGCAASLCVFGWVLADTAPAKTVTTIGQARSYLSRTVTAPAPLFLTASSARRVLGHVKDVQFYRSTGEDFSATVFYRPFDGGSYDGQVGASRLPNESLSRVMASCRARGHQVVRLRVGRYFTRYCHDDITFYYAWRWRHRVYIVSSKYYGGVRPGGLQQLIRAMTYVS